MVMTIESNNVVMVMVMIVVFVVTVMGKRMSWSWGRSEKHFDTKCKWLCHRQHLITYKYIIVRLLLDLT